MRDVQYSSASGVERDFVELPSQINEHWAFEPEVLAVYAKHHKTGEIIPMELVAKIQESAKYGQGFATVEYIAASLSDMDLHAYIRNYRKSRNMYICFSYMNLLRKNGKAGRQVL